MKWDRTWQVFYKVGGQSKFFTLSYETLKAWFGSIMHKNIDEYNDDELLSLYDTYDNELTWYFEYLAKEEGN